MPWSTPQALKEGKWASVGFFLSLPHHAERAREWEQEFLLTAGWMLCQQAHLVKQHFHGSHAQPVSPMTAFCQWGSRLLPAGDSEMPIVITGFILKYSPDLIPNEMHHATNHVSLAWAKRKHTRLGETQRSLYLHLQVTTCIHRHSTDHRRTMLQTLNQDWEGLRNLTNIQRAHKEIGYFQRIDCLSSASISSDTEWVSAENHNPSRSSSWLKKMKCQLTPSNK